MGCNVLCRIETLKCQKVEGKKIKGNIQRIYLTSTGLYLLDIIFKFYSDKTTVSFDKKVVKSRNGVFMKY